MPWNNNEKDQKLIYPTEFRLKTKFEFYEFYGFFFGYYAMALFSRLYVNLFLKIFQNIKILFK